MVTPCQRLPFPDESHFRVFLRHCQESPAHHVLFNDPSCGIKANHSQFLQDVCATRQELLRSVPGTRVNDQGTLHEEFPFICILYQANYEFIVAAFAVLVLGGAVVPISPMTSPEEAADLMQRCQSVTLMAGSTALTHATAIQQVSANQGMQSQVVPIAICTPLQCVMPYIDNAKVISVEQPSVVVFTSGTVGPPKGVVHVRRLLRVSYRPAQPSAYINCVSLWSFSAVRLIKHTLRGRRIEILPTDPAVLWERLRSGGAGFLSANPPVWHGLMDHFQAHLESLPVTQREEYIRGLRGLRTAIVLGGTLSPVRLRFFRNLGKPVKLCHGTTELGRICLITADELSPQKSNCLGRPVAGVTVKLSDGDHGELLIKSPNVFSHYLNDPTATKAMFTADGFYRTGDLVSQQGADFFFHGRACTDFIKYYGYQVPILALEDQLIELPGIKEGFILPMADERCGYRAAALIRLTEAEAGLPSPVFDLVHLRALLTHAVPALMLPTALRFLQAGETVPRTVSGKIIRRDAARRFFPIGDDGLCSATDVQVCLARPPWCQDGPAQP